MVVDRNMDIRGLDARNIIQQVDVFHDIGRQLEVDEVPVGVRRLETAIEFSRRVHRGGLGKEEANEELEGLQRGQGFVWKVFSPKQLKLIDLLNSGEELPWIVMAEGAVRSGKTASANAAWLKFVLGSDYPRHMLTGKTKDTLFRNVLSDIFDVLGEGNFYFNKSEGILRFQGKTVWCLGANDERSESRFRGPTVGSWYADEVTTYPESVMKMAVSRPSVPGARIIWTTNPDTPYHPVHKEYMANEEMLAGGTIESMKFLLEDNWTLSKTYVDNLKRSYSGIWYDRFIEGLWTVAEGAIFDMFMPSNHTFDAVDVPFGRYDQYVVGVDYGTATTCCFTLAGVKFDEGSGLPHYHFLKEFYYDAAKAKALKTDADYSRDMRGFIRGFDAVKVFVPHDATSFTAQLLRDGIGASIVAPDVMDSIRKIQTMLAEGRLLFSKDCEHSIKQFQACVWDARAQQMGIDKPLKPQEDHAMDATRYTIMGHNISGGIPHPTLVVGGLPMY